MAEPAKAQKERRLTIRQARFAAAYADPKTKSQTEAAIKAGYPVSRAHVAGSELVRNQKVIDAVAKRTERRGDIARSIFDRSARKVAQDLEHPDSGPMHALAAWKTSADVMQLVPEEPEQQDPTLKRYEMALALLKAALAGARHPDKLSMIEAAVTRVARLL